MNAPDRTTVARWMTPAASLPRVGGVQPERLGNGRVELRIDPAATTADRLAAARALLHGTAWTVALAITDGAERR